MIQNVVSPVSAKQREKTNTGSSMMAEKCCNSQCCSEQSFSLHFTGHAVCLGLKKKKKILLWCSVCLWCTTSSDLRRVHNIFGWPHVCSCGWMGTSPCWQDPTFCGVPSDKSGGCYSSINAPWVCVLSYIGASMYFSLLFMYVIFGSMWIYFNRVFFGSNPDPSPCHRFSVYTIVKQ